MNINIINKLKSDIRDVKLSMLLDNDIIIKPNIKKLRKGKNLIFDQSYWKVLNKYKGNSIITGSTALYAMDLLDRMPKDIDLIVDKEYLIGEDLCHNRYVGMEGEMDMVGFYIDKKSNMNIDFFHNNHCETIECEGFLFHNPFQIMETKIEISKNRSGSKDISDIIDILRKINPSYKFIL